MAEKKKVKIRFRTVLSFILLTAGLLLIVVPLVMTYITTKRNNDVIEEFLRQVEIASGSIESSDSEEEEIIMNPVVMPSEAPEETPEPSGSPEATGSPTDSSMTRTTKNPKMTKEEMQKRTTGVLMIPKIDLKMLIMDGTDDTTLSVAVGRMTSTGNFDEYGNVVLAGHRSNTFGKYLYSLNKVEPGDKITVQLKEKTLNYTVYKTHIIEPTDFSILKQPKDEKILTIFTCHPPGVGSHRLVVHAKQDE